MTACQRRENTITVISRISYSLYRDIISLELAKEFGRLKKPLALTFLEFIGEMFLNLFC